MLFFFSKISDTVRFIMIKNGHNALLKYIDDLIYCGLPSNIGDSYQFLLDLLQDLGPWTWTLVTRNFVPLVQR